MDEKNFEGTIIGKEETKREVVGDASKYNYERYQSSGGIINEKDYQSALDRAKDTTISDEALILQAESIAKRAGITLLNSKDVLDPRAILYGILRSDRNPGAKYHHSQMSDQRLFAEVLRILEDADSLQKLIETHPHISFS